MTARHYNFIDPLNLLNYPFCNYMNETINDKRDDDEDWFYAQCAKLGRKPTQAQVDRFCDAMPRIMADGRLEERNARLVAIKAVMT
jgi:hypothetical protein